MKPKEEPWSKRYDLGPKPISKGIDCGPNKARLAAVRGKGKAFCSMTVFYAEYGAGAEIVSKNGWLVADFPNHLDAEAFWVMLQDAKPERADVAPR